MPNHRTSSFAHSWTATGLSHHTPPRRNLIRSSSSVTRSGPPFRSRVAKQDLVHDKVGSDCNRSEASSKSANAHSSGPKRYCSSRFPSFPSCDIVLSAPSVEITNSPDRPSCTLSEFRRRGLMKVSPNPTSTRYDSSSVTSSVRWLASLDAGDRSTVAPNWRTVNPRAFSRLLNAPLSSKHHPPRRRSTILGTDQSRPVPTPRLACTSRFSNGTAVRCARWSASSPMRSIDGASLSPMRARYEATKRSVAIGYPITSRVPTMPGSAPEQV